MAENSLPFSYNSKQFNAGFSLSDVIYAPKPTHYKFRDLEGQRFGALSILGFAENRTNVRVWWAACDCGTIKTVTTAKLHRPSKHKKSPTTSCGCGIGQPAAPLGGRHVNPDADSHHPLFHTWGGMKGRCYTESNCSFPRYGGRGITVCDRWRYSFKNFLDDMGERPTPSHSLDRIDNNGNYEPGNVRWATPKEQSANKGKLPGGMTLLGQKRSQSEWAKLTGVPRQTIARRKSVGWCDECILTLPPHSADGCIHRD